MSQYPTLYLCFHGDAGILYVGEKRGAAGRLSLVELAESLQSPCQNRVVYFGSCGTMDIHGASLNGFLSTTGALVIMGYRESVDWVESAAFDVLVLGTLQEVAMTKSGMQDLEESLCERGGSLQKRFGFRLKIAR